MERHDLDEYLETLWHLLENNESDIDNLKRHTKDPFDQEIFEALKADGYVAPDGKKIRLTEKGYARAEQIIRRHRLAERLLTDVLGMESRDVETGACEFEHILAPELVESICTLLGHPRECPHGAKIPEGECCRQARKTISSAVIPISEVEIGEEVKVAYINTRSNSRMHKLSHFGIVPGTFVSVHQRYPSFVIKCGNSQIALEEEIAKEIYIWKKGKPSITADSSVPQRKRRWRFGRKG
jgi:DtxR family Mn-dependent transcriptional regulator